VHITVNKKKSTELNCGKWCEGSRSVLMLKVCAHAYSLERKTENQILWFQYSLISVGRWYNMGINLPPIMTTPTADEWSSCLCKHRKTTHTKQQALAYLQSMFSAPCAVSVLVTMLVARGFCSLNDTAVCHTHKSCLSVHDAYRWHFGDL